MKLYAIVEIDDDMYDEYKNWYIRGDGLDIRYEEDICYRHCKKIADDLLELKPLPERINPLSVDTNNLLDLGYMHGRNDLINQLEGDENE